MTRIQTAVFTVEADYKALFAEKIERDVASMKAWPGNVSAEGWQGDEKDGTVEFILVSKWNYKADFEAWLKRPGHAESHEKPGIQDVRQHVTRRVASYRILAD